MARITVEDPDDARDGRPCGAGQDGGGQQTAHIAPAAGAPALRAPAGLGSRIAARFAAAGGLPRDLPELHATVRIPDPSAAVALADEPRRDGLAPSRGIRDTG